MFDKLNAVERKYEEDEDEKPSPDPDHRVDRPPPIVERANARSGLSSAGVLETQALRQCLAPNV